MAQKYLTDNPANAIDNTMAELEADKVILVTDTNVEKTVLPGLSDSEIVTNSNRISITPGEEGKNLETVTRIWNLLEETHATRRSVVLNIGGGVVTDIGGFAAATYKRGIRTVNYPTTLLGAVDAATGGKTGINYRGLKNEIGAFHLPSKVIISADPFSTLPQSEILSGYAEMIKTAMISVKEFYFSLTDIESVVGNPQRLGPAVEKCVEIKDDVVEQDPREQGLRKILNFGHTAGHAFESILIEKRRPVPHGYAVAHGMLVALLLSNIMLGFDSNEINHYRQFLKQNYGLALVQCSEIEDIILKINRDKKNRKYGEPAFTLLKEIGVPEINCLPSRQDLKEALELYIDMAG